MEGRNQRKKIKDPHTKEGAVTGQCRSILHATYVFLKPSSYGILCNKNPRTYSKARIGENITNL